MPYYCTVPRCTSMAGKAKNVSFHQFPKDEELAEVWNKVLRRGKPYTKYSKVCSLHFTPEDYTMNSVGNKKGQWRSLRKDAVPSRNLPLESPAPYHGHGSTQSASPPSLSPGLMDAQIHQQFAQAIYVQTMLALQAASFRENIEHTPRSDESPTSSAENTLDAINPPSINQMQQLQDFIQKYHTLRLPNLQNNDISPIQSSIQTVSNEPFKCSQCMRWFKDPDVFILHQRTHEKDRIDSHIDSNVDSQTGSVDGLSSSHDENCDPTNQCNDKTDTNIDSSLNSPQISSTVPSESLTNAIDRHVNSLIDNHDGTDTRDKFTNRSISSNPILTNLLNQKVPENCLTNENVMTAMALSMEAYVRSINNIDSHRESCDVKQDGVGTEGFQNGGDLNESTESNRLVIDETA